MCERLIGKLRATLLRLVAVVVGAPVTTHVGPACGAWARHLARGPDDLRVGSAAHTHVERFTCVLRGLRAHSRVNVRHSGLTCEPTTWLSGCEHSSHVIADAYASSCTLGVTQNADRLTPNSPLLPFFAEVVCVLGATPVRQPVGRGELRHAGVRHAGDTPTEGLTWRKTLTPPPALGAATPDGETQVPADGGQARPQGAEAEYETGASSRTRHRRTVVRRNTRDSEQVRPLGETATSKVTSWAQYGCRAD